MPLTTKFLIQLSILIPEVTLEHVLVYERSGNSAKVTSFLGLYMKAKVLLNMDLFLEF